MEWTRSETLALAMHNCTHCHGAGLRFSKKGALAPCNCVLRSIFRVCWDRFVRCTTQERYLSRVSLEPHVGRSRPATWGRKDEEYIADFVLIARRTLDDFENRLFRYHFLLGASWKLCTRKLEIDRGNFFHAVYRIEQKLGRAFRETEPYPLFPLDEYFNGPSRIGPPPARPEATPLRPAALEFPVPVGKTA
ncbi:MAG TPA: hypothetical protein VMG40_19565 [Bryobacteraceae bacterium]|nr:hypothetical protein [Bryobacteraceae bacterium]